MKTFAAALSLAALPGATAFTATNTYRQLKFGG